MIKKKDYNKKERIEHLLELMKTKPMSRHDMAQEVNMTVKSVSKYITDMRFSKKIYIHRYERTMGQFTVYYMTGNLPDAIKPLAYTQDRYNKIYREKMGKGKKVKNQPVFIPRPDYAAHWMFNPC